MDVKEIATEYRKKLSVIPDGKLLFLPKMDANSYSKRQADKQTIGSLFEDVGLLFDPVQEGQEVRTIKVNTLINNMQLRIFRTCVQLVEEMTDYKFVVNNKGEVTGKRVDRNNHFIDALEFLTIKIPYNLETMKIEDWIRPGHYIKADMFRKKPTIELSSAEKLVRSLNPLEQNRKTMYSKEEEYSEIEIDNIISKLSGI